MSCRLTTPFRVRAALVALLVALPATLALHARQRDLPKAPARCPQAWTLKEALATLEVSPHDPYVQYVALQLARREGKGKEVVDQVSRLAFQNTGRAANVNLFDLFTGALAVQESLQLDTMRGNAPRGGAKRGGGKTVDVATLEGPTVKSHPWKKMLAGKKPTVPPLARLVPEDFYLVEFRSVRRLFEITDFADLWSAELFGQVSRDARPHRTGPRLRRQLLVSTSGLGRVLGDALIKEVAVTGSDLLVGEGSDVTLLFRLPLIDNTLYKTLAGALKGEPEPLDALPVPRRNILSVAGRFDKEVLLKEYADTLRGAQRELVEEAKRQGVPEKDAEAVNLAELLGKGLGDQVGLHVYDSAPVFDLDLPGFLGLMTGNFNGRGGLVRGEELLISFIVASINSPAYVSLPVRDEKVVDRVLAQLDRVLVPLARRAGRTGGAGRGVIRLGQDFYRTRLSSGELIRSYAFRIGPITRRVHWGRIGLGLYVATKPFIREDLAAATAEARKARPDAEATAHAILRLRPRNWDRVLPSYRLAWAENNREACLRNLGPIASAGRATVARRGGAEAKAAKAGGEERARQALQLADRLYAVRFFCPEGGRYSLSADGKTCSCNVHGTLRRPEQGLAPKEGGKAPPAFTNVTAALTFLEDGLHAVLVLARK